MGESTKAVCAVVLIAASVAAGLGWMTDRPHTMIWGLRIGGPLVAVLALGLLLKLQFRVDLAPDYLYERSKAYFNRDGFCFAVSSTAADGVGYIEVYFQSQRDAPCLGRVALRPARGFFLTRAKIETIICEIECAPGGFGVARIPVSIPAALQGKRLAFEVGASAQYPDGKGRRIRFRDGIFLRANTRFGDAFTTGLKVATVATGGILLSHPAKVTLDLPVGVSEHVQPTSTPDIKTLWALGDPPLNTVG